MQKNKKLAIVVGVGLVSATIGALVFYQLLSPHFGQAQAEPPSAQVLVAAHDLPRGTQITEEDVRVEDWLEAEIPADAHRQVAGVLGRIVMGQIVAGQVLGQGQLVDIADAGLAAGVPQGMRAVAVHSQQVSGVTQFIEPGDHVDVMMLDGQRNPGNSRLSIRTILRNVPVLATGREPLDDGRPNPIPMVTLLVPSQEAETVILADHAGIVRLALRNPLDAAEDGGAGLNVRGLMARKFRPVKSTASAANAGANKKLLAQQREDD